MNMGFMSHTLLSVFLTFPQYTVELISPPF